MVNLQAELTRQEAKVQTSEEFLYREPSVISRAEPCYDGEENTYGGEEIGPDARLKLEQVSRILARQNCFPERAKTQRPRTHSNRVLSWGSRAGYFGGGIFSLQRNAELWCPNNRVTFPFRTSLLCFFSARIDLLRGEKTMMAKRLDERPHWQCLLCYLFGGIDQPQGDKKW